MTDKKNNIYSLQVGNEGASRLLLLNEMCNPLTLSFIESHIELKNKKILDLGCGIGILSAELAKKSLPHGEVLAVDISQEQLEVAHSIACQNNIENIRFQQLSAFEIDTLECEFDLIYCRFMLAHLSGASEIIEKITRLMHPQSILICEEPNSIETLGCKPEHPVFEQFKKAAAQQVNVSQANFTIGKQSSLDTSLLKQQLWQGILEIKSLLVDSIFLTAIEVDELIHALKEFAKGSHTVHYFEYTQIAARTEI